MADSSEIISQPHHTNSDLFHGGFHITKEQQKLSKENGKPHAANSEKTKLE